MTRLIFGTLSFQKIFLVGERTFSRNHFKPFVKTGEIIKTTFVTDVFDGGVVFNKKLAGISDLNFNEELRVGLPCLRLKVPAKGARTDIGNLSNLVQRNFLFVIGNAVVVNIIDPVVLFFRKIVFETDGRQQCILVILSDDGKCFEKGNDSFRTGHNWRNPLWRHEDNSVAEW